MSVRSRVLAYLLVLTAVALSVAGVTAYLIERARLDNDITEGLRIRTEAFIELANAPDPTTGEAFATSADLMRETMMRVVASPTESAVAHTGLTPRFVPSYPQRLKLENDRELLQIASDHASETVIVRSATTEQAEYRYAAVPIVEPDGDVVAVFTIASDRGARVADLDETFRIYALVALVALAMISVFSWTTVGRMLQPIGVLHNKARRISEHDLSERIPVTGHDDLARLTSTVNGMLDRLERAFEDQRHLLDDASHELRTPLAIIRTNLELLEPRDPGDVERVQQELLDEVNLMSRLVDDLVTLAKSDRPEFVMRAPADIADLTATTLSRARALGERDWQLDETASGIVHVDTQRITQAWLQLAANAVKFSHPGSVVGIGSRVSRREVHFWVRDEGRGIAPADQARVLERFSRVDSGLEGAGLGLPIASAIASAHGGRLDVKSALGQGSTFTLVVPRSGGGA